MSPIQKSQRSVSQRVAIVGAGISGIACSWKLREENLTVDIYEAGDRLGGHANSVLFEGNGHSVHIDTGFIAMNKTTYPQFNAFLEELGVETIPTDMSFGVSADDGAFEWGSYSIASFVGKLSNLLSPFYWRLLFDIARFNLFARDILHDQPTIFRRTRYREAADTDGLKANVSEHDGDALKCIGEYLSEEGYSKQFITLFMIPMAASPWCIDPDEFSRSFPARPLIHFMWRHGLLDTALKTLRWHAFPNGSKTYVDAFQARLPPQHRLHLGTPVQSVSRRDGNVFVELEGGITRGYDRVVLAIHANQALRLLGDSTTDEERRILGCFKTRRNVCYLHSDTTLLPKRPSARVAWNCFLGGSNKPSNQVSLGDSSSPSSSEGLLQSAISVTFDMNKLQRIPFPGERDSPGRVLVTLNPVRVPRSLRSAHVYDHPLISSKTIHMAKRISEINGASGIVFAGAWMGFGFHEDGFAAGAHAARLLVDGREKAGPLNLVPEWNEKEKLGVGLIGFLARMSIVAVQKLLLRMDLQTVVALFGLIFLFAVGYEELQK